MSGAGLSLGGLLTDQRGMLGRKLRMGTICSPIPSGTKTSSSDVCNADWMASLPPHLHNVPLSNLAIPGMLLFLLVPTVFASAIIGAVNGLGCFSIVLRK